MKTLATLGLGAAGAVGWLVSRGHRDPREWPHVAAAEAARLRVQVAEAVAAGRRAAREQEAALERDLAEAATRGDRSA